MKTDIYGLFGMIKDGKAPTKIKYLDKVYKFVGEDYEDEEGNQLLSWLFQDYCVDYLLSAEIEILETTITYKQDNIENNKQDKIEKLDDFYNDNGFGITIDLQKVKNKINEIIDKLNGE